MSPARYTVVDYGFDARRGPCILCGKPEGKRHYCEALYPERKGSRTRSAICHKGHVKVHSKRGLLYCAVCQEEATQRYRERKQAR